ncbi:cation:proton antiporter [Haliea sp. E1-2-M8]|uniref:cation:proton antiporter n=1 Tax=Haliea sp. E1-2-M8 TaxID=3064706 RepID=UPI00272168DD|nr:cation:proton antiporter [Haliea sp. E1-2-M8]MDO8862077.1 cation:proton antiporter [Haliea sp. E1-2-M8]
MSNWLWFLLVGGLMLARGLTATPLQRSPITPAMFYLGLGLLLGPTVLNLFHFNPLQQSALLEVLTEIVVLISLFAAGVKVPAPIDYSRWRAPVMLASVSMAISVGLVAAFAFYVLGMPLGVGVLLGAILAPTDPVLATDVQTRHPGDREPLRFTLTTEAGMNDGSAFPFVMLGLGMLGLHDLGENGLRWVLLDVVWATVAGIVIGLVAGSALAHLAHKVRGASPSHRLLDNFLGLGLIALVYGLSLLVYAWGFLAVFFAAVSLSQTEYRLSLRENSLGESQPSAIDTDREKPRLDQSVPPSVSGGSLIFKEQLELLSEMMLVLLIGGTLFLDSWSWPAVSLALFLFLVVRPASVVLGLLGTQTSWPLRGMVGWFGVRGIGSLYYLMYAIQHGLSEPVALELVSLVLIVVTLSIVVHGISVKPLMARFQRHRTSKKRNGRDT